MVHHTGADGPSQFLKINASHKARGFPKRGRYHTAYHYVVESDGTVLQAHPDSVPLGHTRNGRINLHSIAIVLAGNFEHHAVPQKQRMALKALLRSLKEMYGVSENKIIGHREASATTCPGRYLNDIIKHFIF